MNRPSQYVPNVLYGIVGLVGGFLLYWGIQDIISPAFASSITVSWLDQILTDLGRHIWIPAVGVFLITVGVSPLITSITQKIRIVRILVSVLGISLLGIGSVIVVITLSMIGGFIYVSPIFLTGAVLLALAFGFRGPELQSTRLSP